jgi:hypothetical protein
MVTTLSTLTSLESLSLKFESPRFDQAGRRPPPSTRSVLPALTRLAFKGVSEYLEDLVARFDAPQLNSLDITFFNQLIFDTPQFTQFISRTATLKAPEEARVVFDGDRAWVKLSSQTSGHGHLRVYIGCMQLDWQASSLGQVCNSSLPPLSTLEDLYIAEGEAFDDDLQQQQDDIENIQWLELLRPFTAVTNLYMSREFARRIVPALQDLVGGRTTEVLPALQNIFLEERHPSDTVDEILQDIIGQFVATRQIASHPITISRCGYIDWD